MANRKILLLSMSIESDLYKTLHKTIGSIVDDCRLVFDKSGLSISVVDGGNVAICSSSIDKSLFETYTIKKPFEVGWTLNDIKEKGVLNAYNKGLVHMDLFEVDGISSESGYICEIRHDIFKDTIRLPSTDSIRCNPKIPTLNSNCVFEIDKKTLKKITDRDSSLGVIFENETVVFADNPIDLTWTTEAMSVPSKESGKSVYSSNYIVAFLSALPKKSNITFKFASDYPCELSCEIAEGFNVGYLIAPRIERD